MLVDKALNLMMEHGEQFSYPKSDRFEALKKETLYEAYAQDEDYGASKGKGKSLKSGSSSSKKG
jgi:hypothetical protein